jgi:hypothetical protein
MFDEEEENQEESGEATRASVKKEIAKQSPHAKRY